MRPARSPLREDRPFLVVVCPTCGREFPTQRRRDLAFCGAACQRRAWRAVVKLQGTHDGTGKRL